MQGNCTFYTAKEFFNTKALFLPYNVYHVSVTVASFCAGPVEVGFDQAGLTLGESDGDLMVSVSVLQAIASTVSVDIAVISGTAMEQEG